MFYKSWSNQRCAGYVWFFSNTAYDNTKNKNNKKTCLEGWIKVIVGQYNFKHGYECILLPFDSRTRNEPSPWTLWQNFNINSCVILIITSESTALFVVLELFRLKISFGFILHQQPSQDQMYLYYLWELST